MIRGVGRVDDKSYKYTLDPSSSCICLTTPFAFLLRSHAQAVLSMTMEETIMKDTTVMTEGKPQEPQDADELRLAQMGR